jgi:small nuclear ribonucleoprotein (snRNP)-like protein
MGFDQKAMTLVGKQVQVKMFNGYIISGTMSHVSKGYVCFILKPQEEQQKKTSIRRLAIRDITSMVEV